MDRNEKALIELSKTFKLFSEINTLIKTYKNQKKLTSDDCSKRMNKKDDSYKRQKRKFSDYSIKMKKLDLNNNSINLTKHDHHNRSHKKNKSKVNFRGKSLFFKNDNKSQDKQIKINLVNQKFKIANDFNEENSNQFLNEKDECLKEVFLTDEIEEKESIDFYDQNKKENKFNLSIIKKNKINDNLNRNNAKRKIIESELIEGKK